MHRAVLKRPLSVLKYAMTLDGKIATGGLAAGPDTVHRGFRASQQQQQRWSLQHAGLRLGVF
jgi:riboflavin biosynthesis pyrimidine reductase